MTVNFGGQIICVKVAPNNETYETLKNQEKTYCGAKNGHLKVMKEAYGQTKCFLMEY